MKKGIIFFMLIAASLLSEATIYTVNSNNWTGTGAGTTGDLRYCITQANADATAGPHEIRFAAGITGPILWRSIAIGNATQRIIINGETASGWSCGNPTVILQQDGTWAQNVWTLQGAGVILRSLIFQGASPRLTAGTSEIYGCWFNLNAAGTGGSATADMMGASSVYITGGSNHIVGSNDCNRNVFSMRGTNCWQGFMVINGANGTTLNGNYFGTDKTGLAELSDFNSGTGIIRIEGNTSNLTISNNVISCAGGSTGRGIVTTTAVNVSGLTISGNKIGLNANGNVAAGFGNDNGGIVLIGGVTGNGITISNNDIGSNGYGTFDNNSCGMIIASSFSNVTISDNYIGVTRAFANAGNAFAGIFVTTAINTISLTNNVIGFNGFGATRSHGWELSSCTNVIATGNYVGVNAASANIGNGNSGIVFSSCSNVTITNNYVCNNEGRRTDIPNGGIVIAGGNNFTIQNNRVGVAPNGTGAGQLNIGGNARGGNGIYVENGALRVRIGGMAANQQNYVAYSATYGINCYGTSTDFVEMRWNSIYCNAQKGINLNYGANQANNGLPAPVITGPNPNPPTSISGTKPANTYLDVFGTNACSASCITNPQGQLYKGEATSYPGGTAGTTWTFAPGGNIMDYLTALATGVPGTSNCTALGIATCRTSEFSGCEDNVLPVDFTGVKAVYNPDRTVTVSWQTSSEINNSYFVVMRSENGEFFYPLAVLDGKGNSSTTSSYSFTDPMPYNSVSYYKIKQVDKDGSSGYSPVVAAKAGDSDWIIYPNPAEDRIQISKGGQVENIEVLIRDVLGQEVIAPFMTKGENSIDVSILPSGTYFVEIRTEEGVRTGKFVKR